MKSDSSFPRVPSWTTLVVVCKDCQKRSSGPERLKTKEALREARIALKTQRPRPRVVTTSCLGLCPKRALAIASAGSAAGPRIDVAETLDDVAATVNRLVGGAI